MADCEIGTNGQLNTSSEGFILRLHPCNEEAKGEDVTMGYSVM